MAAVLIDSRLPIDATCKYTSTKPKIPSNTVRSQIIISAASFNIVLRPFSPSDLPHLIKLRTQIEVMRNTSKGAIDETVEATEEFMARFLPPNDTTTFNYAILIQGLDTGDVPEHIGVMGCHITSPVANIGYMIRKEWWGRGIASTAVKTFLEEWWKLEREVVNIEDVTLENGTIKVGDMLFDPSMVTPCENIGQTNYQTMRLPEILLAEIDVNNVGSRKVLERSGFRYQRQYDIPENGGIVTIGLYILERPAVESLDV